MEKEEEENKEKKTVELLFIIIDCTGYVWHSDNAKQIDRTQFFAPPPLKVACVVDGNHFAQPN